MPETEIPDYYELLEISPQATQETIHRVYRYLAARYHPDSIGTGNLEKFTQLTSAHKVLSDPNKRSEYDTQRATRQPAIENPMVFKAFSPSVFKRTIEVSIGSALSTDLFCRLRYDGCCWVHSRAAVILWPYLAVWSFHHAIFPLSPERPPKC